MLAVVALRLRRQLDETSKHETRGIKRSRFVEKVCGVIAKPFDGAYFIAAGLLCFYTFTTYMQKYLVNTAGMYANVASAVFS